MAKTMKSKKQSVRKRNFKRRRGVFKKQGAISSVMMGTGFPEKLAVKLKYSDTIIMTSTLGSLENYQFRLNSIFDPDFTSTGHQPLYSDQYGALYNRYLVIGAKLSARFVPYESNTTPVIITLFHNDDTTIINSSSIEYCSEQSNAKTYLVGDGGDGGKMLTLKWSPKKTFGGSLLGNTDLNTAVNANPTEQSIASLLMQTADTLSSGSVAVQVNIEFIVVYTDLRDVVGS